eukprot:15467363-Alexandrium_andersonii.AAC.1
MLLRKQGICTKVERALRGPLHALVNPPELLVERAVPIGEHAGLGAQRRGGGNSNRIGLVPLQVLTPIWGIESARRWP